MTALRPLSALVTSSGIKTVLLVLNRPLDGEVNILKKLWSKAVFRACADGGSNRLYNCLGGERVSYIPDIITGDFDSANKDVLSYYKDKGSVIIKTEDQDHTDFTKCLQVTLDRVKDMDFDYVTVIGAFGGRMDHVFSNINTLYAAKDITSKPVLLFSEGSLACLLSQGHHTLQVDTGVEAEWCGFFPLANTCRHVTTTGLKWNLKDDEMRFGGCVSSSNTYDGSPSVTIETDEPLLWMMGYKDV